MAVSAKAKSGLGAASVKPPELRRAARTVRAPRLGTDPSYEEARIDEVSKRCELYELRVARRKADLLDAGEVRAGYIAVTNAIKRVIAQSKLTKAEKENVISNLLTPAEFAANVAKQSADRAKGEASPVIGNGGIDHVEDT